MTDDDTLSLSLPTLKCKRCGHTWTPRSNKLPKVCPSPRCKSPYWNQERRKKREKNAGQPVDITEPSA